MPHDFMPTRPAEHRCDVLVIGGGPAGSTAATLLAEKGHRVTLLEKAHHPRFHIGESLLPANLPLFERLGVRDEVERIGMQQVGRRVRLAVARTQPVLRVRRRLGQVACRTPTRCAARSSTRSCFAMPRARRADVIEGCRVRDVDFDADGVRIVQAEHDDGAQRELARTLRGRCLGPRHLPGQPSRHQAAQPQAQQRRAVRPFRRARRATRASTKATSASSGSSTAGSGSSRWPTAPPASAR